MQSIKMNTLKLILFLFTFLLYHQNSSAQLILENLADLKLGLSSEQFERLKFEKKKQASYWDQYFGWEIEYKGVSFEIFLDSLDYKYKDENPNIYPTDCTPYPFLARIRVLSNQVQTEKGIRIGSTEHEVWRAYQNLAQVEVWDIVDEQDKTIKCIKFTYDFKSACLPFHIIYRTLVFQLKDNRVITFWTALEMADYE